MAIQPLLGELDFVNIVIAREPGMMCSVGRQGSGINCCIIASL